MLAHVAADAVQDELAGLERREAAGSGPAMWNYSVAGRADTRQHDAMAGPFLRIKQGCGEMFQIHSSYLPMAGSAAGGVVPFFADSFVSCAYNGFVVVGDLCVLGGLWGEGIRVHP